jgi:hypothetical protein
MVYWAAVVPPNSTNNAIGPEALTDIAFVGNQMFGTTFNNLVSINDTTGASMTVVPWSFGSGGTNALVGERNKLIAATNADGTFFNTNTNGTGQTLLGASVAPSAGDLAFNGKTLYESTLGNGGDMLVNVTTHTAIANFTVGGQFLQSVFGLATDSTGTTYAVDGTEIYTVNLTNAVLTPILNYAGHGLGDANGTAFLAENINPAVPEPSTWVMLLLGFCGMAFAGLRRARNSIISA